LGFTQYFTVVYGPYEQNFIQYTDAAFSLLQSQFGQYSFADNTSFIRIFTNLMLIGYLFLMIIILVNLLIAMMAQSLKASYRVAFQHHCHIIAELVHHYQKVYIVPPFNIIQFVFDIYNIATKKKNFDEELEIVDSLIPKEVVFQKIVQIFKLENKINEKAFWESEEFMYSWRGILDEEKEEEVEDD